MAKIGGVILAGGSSSRLGQPKQLLDLVGEPLLRHTVRNALGSRLSHVILVLGAQAAEIDAAVGRLGQTTIVNPDFAAGQSTSMHAGLAALDPDVDAAMFLLGDQPSVTPEMIDSILDRYETTGAPLVQAKYTDGPGNPVLFKASLFPELLEITGDEGARSVVARHRSEIAFVVFTDRAIPQDVDTLDDYAALLAAWTAECAGS